jgi:hypothetical protein
VERDKRIEAAKKRLEEFRANQHQVHPRAPEHPNDRHLRDIKLLLFILVAMAVIAGVLYLVATVEEQREKIGRAPERMERAALSGAVETHQPVVFRAGPLAVVAAQFAQGADGPAARLLAQ